MTEAERNKLIRKLAELDIDISDYLDSLHKAQYVNDKAAVNLYQTTIASLRAQRKQLEKDLDDFSK